MKAVEISELLQRFRARVHTGLANQKEEVSVNKSKKLTAAVAATAVASAIVAPVASASVSFSDINGSYAKDAILELANAGIIVGENGKFNPSANIKRQDFAIIMAKALKLDLTKAPATATFSDVPTTHYSYAAVEAAVKAGLLSGTGNGNFGLGTNLTREQMAVVFVNALGVDVSGLGSTLKFADASSISAWAKDAVAFAVDAKLLSGDNNNKFNPAANAERQQVAVVASNFLKAQEVYKTAQLKAATVKDSETLELSFTKAVDALTAADVAVKVKASGAAVAVKSVTLSADKKSATVKVDRLASGTTFTATYGSKTVEFATVATGKVELTSVTATNANEITVKFSAAVADTSKAVVELKKGLASQNITTKWNDAKDTVVLTGVVKFEGTYTVSVTGVSDAALTGTVEFAKEEAKSIEIVSSEVTLLDNAVVDYNVLNQYGKEMVVSSGDVKVTAYDKTTAAAGALNVTVSAARSEIAFDNIATKGAKVDDEVILTVTYKGITQTKILKVKKAPAATDIELSVVAPKEGAARITDGDNGLVLGYTLKDQYGKEITLTANQNGATAIKNADGVTFYTSDETIIDPATFATGADGKLTFDVEATNLTAPKTVIITAVVGATGDHATTTVVVNPVAFQKTVTLGSPTAMVVDGEEFTLDYTVADTYGVAIEKKNVNPGQVNGEITFSSNDLNIVNPATDITFDANKNLVINPKKDGQVTIKVLVHGKETGSVSLDVQPAAVATKIVGLKGLPAQFEVGATASFSYANLQVKDQYNRDFKLTNQRIDVVAKDNNADKVNVSASNFTNGSVDFTGAVAGTEVFTVSVNGVPGATFEYTAKTVAASSITAYDVDAVGTLYAPASNAAAIWADAHAAGAYDVELNLFGKTSDGNRVELAGATQNDFVYLSTDSSVVTTDGKTLHATGKGTATIEVYSDLTLSKKIATVNVTVSDATPTVASIKIPATVSGAEQTDIELTGASIKDQYGVELLGNVITGAAGHDFAAAGVSYLVTDSAEVSSIGVSAGKIVFTSDDIAATKNFTLTIYKNGVKGTGTVTVTNN